MNAGTGAAGAERRDHAQTGCRSVADALAPTPEQRPGALHAHEAAQDGDHEDDAREQQGDLGDVVDEEPHRIARPGGEVEVCDITEQPHPERVVPPVENDPGGRREDHGNPPERRCSSVRPAGTGGCRTLGIREPIHVTHRPPARFPATVPLVTRIDRDGAR
jgi:hypothetical protein